MMEQEFQEQQYKSYTKSTPSWILERCPARSDDERNLALFNAGDRDGLIKANMAIPTAIATKLYRKLSYRGDIDLEDVLQMSYEGLIKAVDGWTPDQGCLYNYARTIIDRWVWSSIQHTVETIYIPDKVAVMTKRIRAMYRDYDRAGKVPPTFQEIKTEMQKYWSTEISDSYIRNALHAMTISIQDVSNITIGDADDADEVDFFEGLVDDDMEVCERLGLFDEAALAREFMTARQAATVRDRLENDRDWTEMAKERGVSPQAVQHMYKAGIDIARKNLFMMGYVYEPTN